MSPTMRKFHIEELPPSSPHDARVDGPFANRSSAAPVSVDVGVQSRYLSPEWGSGDCRFKSGHPSLCEKRPCNGFVTGPFAQCGVFHCPEGSGGRAITVARAPPVLAKSAAREGDVHLHQRVHHVLASRDGQVVEDGAPGAGERHHAKPRVRPGSCGSIAGARRGFRRGRRESSPCRNRARLRRRLGGVQRLGERRHLPLFAVGGEPE